MDEPIVKVCYTLCLEQYRRRMKAISRISWRQTATAFLLVVLHIAVVIIIYGCFSSQSVLEMGISGLLVLLVLGITWRVKNKNQVKQLFSVEPPIKQREISIEFYPDGFRAFHSCGEIHMPYRYLYRIVETKDLFLLYIQCNRIIYLENDTIIQRDTEALAQLLQRQGIPYRMLCKRK